MPAGTLLARFPLVGPGGEPLDLRRTLLSHGVASLPPALIEEDGSALEVTLPVPSGHPRIVRVAQEGEDAAALSVAGRPPGKKAAAHLIDSVRHILRLDEDLSEFYRLVGEDRDLAWAAAGAGRMIRSGSVFEEVVKTICTTNCAWSATVRMTSSLVEHLGRPAGGAPKTGWRGRTFPTPEAMAAAPEELYRDQMRAGYRGRYLKQLAESVASGEEDLESLGVAPASELPDEVMAGRLQALPGVGPYAAAHVMLMLGRYTPLILDSWTRPKYARLAGRRKVTDAAIVCRFKRYGRYSGLAFWLYLTRDWFDAPVEGAG